MNGLEVAAVLCLILPIGAADVVHESTQDLHTGTDRAEDVPDYSSRGLVFVSSPAALRWAIAWGAGVVVFRQHLDMRNDPITLPYGCKGSSQTVSVQGSCERRSSAVNKGREACTILAPSGGLHIKHLERNAASYKQGSPSCKLVVSDVRFVRQQRADTVARPPRVPSNHASMLHVGPATELWFRNVHLDEESSDVLLSQATGMDVAPGAAVFMSGGSFTQQRAVQVRLQQNATATFRGVDFRATKARSLPTQDHRSLPPAQIRAAYNEGEQNPVRRSRQSVLAGDAKQAPFELHAGAVATVCDSRLTGHSAPVTGVYSLDDSTGSVVFEKAEPEAPLQACEDASESPTFPHRGLAPMRQRGTRLPDQSMVTAIVLHAWNSSQARQLQKTNAPDAQAGSGSAYGQAEPVREGPEGGDSNRGDGFMKAPSLEICICIVLALFFMIMACIIRCVWQHRVLQEVHQKIEEASGVGTEEAASVAVSHATETGQCSLGASQTPQGNSVSSTIALVSRLVQRFFPTSHSLGQSSCTTTGSSVRNPTAGGTSSTQAAGQSASAGNSRACSGGNTCGRSTLTQPAGTQTVKVRHQDVAEAHRHESVPAAIQGTTMPPRRVHTLTAGSVCGPPRKGSQSTKPQLQPELSASADDDVDMLLPPPPAAEQDAPGPNLGACAPAQKDSDSSLRRNNSRDPYQGMFVENGTVVIQRGDYPEYRIPGMAANDAHPWDFIPQCPRAGPMNSAIGVVGAGGRMPGESNAEDSQHRRRRPHRPGRLESSDIEQALDDLRARGSLLFGRYRLVGGRKTGGQGVVQFAEDAEVRNADDTNSAVGRYAVKFFVRQACFDRESALYQNGRLQSMMPAVKEVMPNADGYHTMLSGAAWPPCIVLERGDTLTDWLRRLEPGFVWKVNVLCDVATRLKDLHSAGYVHLDLKPANILYRQHECSWILIDFGCAAVQNRMVGLCFSLAYAPPEVIQASEQRERSMIADPAIDMWALGVIAFELLTGCRALPEHSMGRRAIQDCIAGRDGARLPWELIDEQEASHTLRVFRKSILACLSRNPRRRPTARDLLSAWNNIFRDSLSGERYMP